MKIEQFLQDIRNKHIAVIGAGISNMPLIRLLCDAGLRVTVRDKKTAEELGAQGEALHSLGVKTVLGRNYLDHISEEIVFRTPGVHPQHPSLEAARSRGARITSEMELFFEVCPCEVIGITGSDGKTTTTTLVFEMLKHAGYTCYLGGNIGTPLLSRVSEMKESDIAIVELSSFQLMDMQVSPSIAAITNLSPNHLDYHKDYKEYMLAKTNIYQHQKKGDRLILNRDDADSLRLPANSNCALELSSLNIPVGNGAFLRGDTLYLARGGSARPLMEANEIGMPGRHNIANVLMAAAIVQDRCTDEDISTVAHEFAGVPHRIELIRQKDGVKYYNDSIASSPTRTIAGLNAFSQKVILIAGGYDKNIPYDVLGQPICEHVKDLILTGATAAKIRASVEHASAVEKPAIYDVTNLAEAVQQAAQIAQTGDVVIMSPASASFDSFKNFAERGDAFRGFVQAL